ncbi:putative proteasome regulatory non-ATP-ase subunit 2 [Leptomonas pyrrhocoris]|uniref:Putative proteasome regulatory non-ATP-ase subunit 2 n=1 Tax=Leptomonas pyrrhocoris TaxID=157538 RepID=A0A0M9G907_LEPPY|nr:putative proteasome regulatory non-ATP-ase subunit 2 [Leptomonas pyrrhocoris]XP_015663728.1 putative proteasome regulatory non-ATP-ase subunit 2 [Leptomonas pyrrhocoris]XP_015663729.1 putative proteasome regulatory non-ATP-ase subunit 2 [Leptomonas pyrrhocoris]XP_015663730.1 putative proteasome regulatory non-ATP-ase subunit 2 [Leptomonas pyrrhocoris]XP_015663731.1 putative proteasome regulatory non-ATP-ase subunit 2 [Leptomonas pyrrhocoris]KPA85288.1 putative proteasome regulatory non-ATP-|eukprot:XP_015663727.1 putative proteasome regulatory non-ATP-ase subunit 2 [Leptomonas pyrrhocoris]
MVHGLSSAKGVLALLGEQDNVVVLFALKRLSALMDTFWHEVSAELPLIEELAASGTLADETRRLASLVASQVYFHLGDYSNSVNHALAAGTAFDATTRSLFTDTILSRCIDTYVVFQETPESERAELPPKLEELFVSLTKSWVMENETVADLKEMVGFTVRARRLDFLEKVLRQCLVKTHSAEILNFTFNVANILLQDITFRRKVLRLLADLYTDGLSTIDYYSLAHCLLFLGDVEATSNLIYGLWKADNKTVAYQLAFDLFEYGNQEYLSGVVAYLEKQLGESERVLAEQPAEAKSEDDGAKNSAAAASPADAETANASSPTVAAAKPETPEHKLIAVLSGELTTNLNVKFLYSRCCADVHILAHIKKMSDPRNSVIHNATVVSNALMYSGTTMDGFLRDNLKWLGAAQYWSKFTAVASTGAIHRGHTEEAMRVLDQYLPKGSSVPTLPYQEAGALYALGLIHSPLGVTRDRSTIQYLEENLQKFSANVQMVHGASLGIGLTAMGLQDESLYDALFTCVTGMDAVGAEGAAVGVGMLMLGSGNDIVLQSLKNVAYEDNQKEKVIRGVCMAMALINLGREDEALPLAEELLASGDPWVRLGGCFVLGLAYAGTESTKTIEMLLNITVKDMSDDVRRTAATMIGFLTFKDPNLCLDLIRVLVDSYNPHVRYGVAMALAVSAAGTGNAAVINVLWDMKEDIVEYVRQGACMALAMVMVQLTEKENPKVKEFRQLVDKKVEDRNESRCSKFGYVLAAGLLDAGGRNCTFALHKQRHRLDKAVVGVFMFLQYWYWYPYLLMITLAMQPTCIIALNESLDLPEYTFKSNAPPSTYAVPKSVLQEKKVKSSEAPAVVLSITRKEEELRQRRHQSAAGDAGTSASATGGAAAGEAGEGKGAGGGKKGEEGDASAAAAAEKEPNFELLHNPARVTAHQFAAITHDVDPRYKPMKPRPMGICLLRDMKPELGAQSLVKPVVLTDRDEASVPEPFSYP